MTKIKVELSGRDSIEMNWTANRQVKDFKMMGCAKFLTQFHELKRQHGNDISQWPLPSATDHVSILLRELILKVREEWSFPYPHEEICHCRNVSLKFVDETIISGAHTPEEVRRITLASTGCGTCHPQIMKIIEFRLGRAKES